MTRTKPSAIDLALIAEAERHGTTVTATQLERWRRQLWLAHAKHSLTPRQHHPTTARSRTQGHLPGRRLRARAQYQLGRLDVLGDR
ncbi:hypothetical protein [Streptomyces sp. NPDC051183]|uniref:hypothetical protein n=1 Tax=Streptomyces sp. NPDC051183 TaxID=3155165 RepID=UPI00343048AF